MKKVIPVIALILSTQTLAADVDLKANMKQMKVEFKQAAQATQVTEMKQAIASLSALVEQSKTGDYPPEKFDLYLEGFNKLSHALEQVEQDLDKGDLEGAKSKLRVVDQLREEYHDKRNPSIWSKLFG